MARWFRALAYSAQRQLRKARSFEKEQEKRLLETYAHGRKKRRGATSGEREKKLLGGRGAGGPDKR